MTTKSKANVTESTDDVEALRAQLAELQAQLAATKTRRAPRKKSAEEQAAAEAKAAARAGFETINYEDASTSLGRLQLMGRKVHIYAFYKVVKHLSYDRLARLLFSLCEEIAARTGKSVDDVINDVTTRVPKAAKAEGTESAGEGETPDAE